MKKIKGLPIVYSFESNVSMYIDDNKQRHFIAPNDVVYLAEKHGVEETTWEKVCKERSLMYHWLQMHKEENKKLIRFINGIVSYNNFHTPFCIEGRGEVKSLEDLCINYFDLFAVSEGVYIEQYKGVRLLSSQETSSKFESYIDERYDYLELNQGNYRFKGTNSVWLIEKTV